MVHTERLEGRVVRARGIAAEPDQEVVRRLMVLERHASLGGRILNRRLAGLAWIWGSPSPEFFLFSTARCDPMDCDR